MKITSKILNNINESEVDINLKGSMKIIKDNIKFLVDDEKEAIEGYNKFLKEIVSSVDEKTYEKIKKVIDHISDEEQDHIKELDSLFEELKSIL